MIAVKAKQAILANQACQTHAEIMACQASFRRVKLSFMMIALTNTKGGTGKSTLACHLALMLFDRGYRVALLDTDEQQSSASWIKNAEPGLPVIVATETDAIRRAKQELLKTHDIIVADSPGKAGDAASAVALLSDLALIPMQASIVDLRAIQEALKFIRLAQELSGGARPKATLVLTMTAKGDLKTKQLREELKGFSVPVANSEIRRLNALRDSADTAVTRMNTREGKTAAADLEALFKEMIAPALEEMQKPTTQKEESNYVTS